MTRVNVLKVPGWTQTLESSVTSASGVDGGRRILLDWDIENVTGVFGNDAGTGTDYWNIHAEGHILRKTRKIRSDAKYIVLPEVNGLAAETSCWVTYRVPGGYEPQNGAYGATGLVGAPEMYSAGSEYTFTGFTELTGVTDAVNDSVEIQLVPATGGLLVKSVKVLTDGTNINMFIYSGDANTYANLIYRKDGINLQEIDNSEWVIPIANTSIWVGYQDVGANATQANTKIEIKGSPLI